jgi:hypothetical protein
MKFETDIIIDTNLLDKSPQGIILEFKFSGVHDHRAWPGWEIKAYLEEEMNNHKPDAVLVNFLHYKYGAGNELGNALFPCAINSKEKSFRPCAIIAKGFTKKSVQSLLNAGMIQKVFNIVVLEDKVEALELLKKELSTTKI